MQVWSVSQTPRLTANRLVSTSTMGIQILQKSSLRIVKMFLVIEWLDMNIGPVFRWFVSLTSFDHQNSIQMVWSIMKLFSILDTGFVVIRYTRQFLIRSRGNISRIKKVKITWKQNQRSPLNFRQVTKNISSISN